MAVLVQSAVVAPPNLPVLTSESGIIPKQSRTLLGTSLKRLECRAPGHLSRPFTSARGRRRACTPVAGVRHATELLKAEVVRAITPKRAGLLLKQGGETAWHLLDVRPVWEFERANIPGSMHVPLFVEEDDTSPLTLLKRQIQFGFGGWWLGQRLTKENDDFVSQVAAAVPHSKDTRLLVACGEGLRSLVAVDKLHEAGFRHLAWLAGGLNDARDGDFASVQGTTKLQYSTAGGVQGLLLKLGQELQARRGGS